jgi:hypothetical protein
LCLPVAMSLASHTSSPRRWCIAHRVAQLTERITQRLKFDLAEELRKEVVLETEKKEELRTRLHSYLESELRTHSCPMCAQLMTSPRVPMLLVPCGHTFW